MKYALPLTALMLAACSSTGTDKVTSRAVISDSTFPPIKAFSVAQPTAPQRANADIARDFLALSFRLEDGRRLPHFTRFDDPIRVRVVGDRIPATLQPDLTRLIARLRNEAGIDIQQTADPRVANVTIQAVKRESIKRTLPTAACFVGLNVSDIKEFRRKRRSVDTSWSRIKKREKVALFIPYDETPQEIRDCLHEELAQSIGPLNDLYRLTDSIFNDDNMHSVLTGFDMLMLRLTYHPSLRSGMTASEVAQRLPAILHKLNPDGEHTLSDPLPASDDRWVKTINETLEPDQTLEDRLQNANRAVALSQQYQTLDPRRAYSHFVLGKLLYGHDPDLARRHLEVAYSIYKARDPLSLQTAQTAQRLAIFALAENRPQDALDLIAPSITVATQHENARVLANMLIVKAETLNLLGRNDEARQTRLDSLGWARYGYGSDWAVRAKLNEIAALNPLKRKG